jgi:DNA gyrase/topoisomerase IV subunit A
MDQMLPKLYKDYGEYSNYRNFPLDVDGLKPVERRVLLSAYKIAKNKLVKSRQVETYACGHFHPHGEAYGTLVQLVRQGFLIGQGNFGTNIGVEPIGAAAPRYTECKLDPKTIELTFKHINYVPWIDTEMNDKEPLFLPTMFPLCLIGKDYTQGIGFGYKTMIPCYEAKDLFKRLLWLNGKRKTKPIISPITDCRITSDSKALDQLLTTGKAKIDVEGIIQIEPRKNQVILKSWPPGKRFESFLNKFSKELNENLIGFSDLSVKETHIVFEVLRERNRDKIFKEFVEKLKESIKGSILFETIIVDIDRKVLLKSIDDMIKDTYEVFIAINKRMLNEKLLKLKEKYNNYKMLEKIRKPLSTCISKNYTIEETSLSIEKTHKVPKEKILELVDKYKIQKLLTLNTDTKDIVNEMNKTQLNLKNISEYVLEQYGGFI